jgi:hypothetical protein
MLSGLKADRNIQKSGQYMMSAEVAVSEVCAFSKVVNETLLPLKSHHVQPLGLNFSMTVNVAASRLNTKKPFTNLFKCLVNVIIFLAPMSGFNQVLAEDENINRLVRYP